MSTLGILLTVYIVSVLVAMVFAAMGHAAGLSAKDTVFLVHVCIPIVGTFIAAVVLIASLVHGCKK